MSCSWIQCKLVRCQIPQALNKGNLHYTKINVWPDIYVYNVYVWGQTLKRLQHLPGGPWTAFLLGSRCAELPSNCLRTAWPSNCLRTVFETARKGCPSGPETRFSTILGRFWKQFWWFFEVALRERLDSQREGPNLCFGWQAWYETHISHFARNPQIDENR